MKNLNLDWYFYTPTDDDDPCCHLTATLDGKVVYSATRYTEEECYHELMEKLGYNVTEEYDWEGNHEDSD